VRTHLNRLYLNRLYLNKRLQTDRILTKNLDQYFLRNNGFILTKNFQYGKFNIFSQVKRNKYFKFYYGAYISQNH